MKVSIRCSNGDQYSVEFNPEITVADFKEVIEKQTEIPANQQRLIYRGRVLKDTQPMSEYSLSIIMLYSLV